MIDVRPSGMLTTQQKRLYDFIVAWVIERDVPPSFDEMKNGLGLASKSGIHRMIIALEERGFIRRLPERARAIEIIGLRHEERVVTHIIDEPVFANDASLMTTDAVRHELSQLLLRVRRLRRELSNRRPLSQRTAQLREKMRLAGVGRAEVDAELSRRPA